MPAYDYKCGSCLIVDERIFSIGEAPRIFACQWCGGIQQLVIGAGVQIAPSALEGKGAQVRATNLGDRRLEKDRDAYRRLRDRGIQPDTVGGSAKVETWADDQMDVTWRPRLKGLSKDPWKSVKQRVKEGTQISKEAGMTTEDVKSWK